MSNKTGKPTLANFVEKASVKIWVKENRSIKHNGTGFWVSENLILTCYHVINNFSEIFIGADTNNLKVIKPIINELAQGKDLALLESETKSDIWVYLFDDISEKPELSVFGFSVDFSNADNLLNIQYEGYSEDVRKWIKFTKAKVISGFSGSALLNEKDGCVIGVVSETFSNVQELGGLAVPTPIVFECFPELKDIEKHKDWKLEKIHEAQQNGKFQIERLLTSPPFNPPIFLGRDKDLESVHQKLFAGQNFLMLVNGQGGIGKTSFASKYWEKYENHYSHLAFLFVENGIANALLSLARKLGLEFTTQNQNLDILIDTVANLQKPCLLILDNANNENDLNANILILRQCSNFHILLTSRLAEYIHAQKHPIEPLSEENAIALFKEHYKAFEENETEFFYQIFEAIGKNTLLIELFAKNLNHFNNKLRKRYTLQNLLDDLAKGLTKLSQSKEVHTSYQAKGTGLRTESPESIILAMYDLTELSEAQKILLSIFAVLPAENIGFETLEKFCESQNLDQDLLALAQKGWIEYNENAASFKCNPLVQEITRHKNQNQLFADCKKMISFLIDELNWQDNPNYHQENYKYATLYSHYAESVVNHFAEPYQYFSVLSERIGKFHEITGNLSQALNFYEKYKNLAEKLVAQNPDYESVLAISYEKLGSTHSSLGNLQQALQFFELETELFKKLYDSYPSNVDFKNGLAISYEKLGFTHSSLGNLQQALQFFKKRHQLAKELYESDANKFKYYFAASFSHLGEIHSSLGNLKKALTFFEESNELLQKLPNSDLKKEALAISYGKLGEIHSILGNLDNSLSFHQKANQEIRELYGKNPDNVSYKNGLASSCLALGDWYEKSKDIQKAKSYFQEAEKLWVQLVTQVA